MGTLATIKRANILRKEENLPDKEFRHLDGCYLENLAESLNLRAHSHKRKGHRVGGYIRKRTERERGALKERYIVEEQESAERTRKGGCDKI
jgi:hypothetical protein